MNQETLRTRIETALLNGSEWVEYMLCEAIALAESGKRGMSVPAHMTKSGVAEFVTFPRQ